MIKDTKNKSNPMNGGFLSFKKNYKFKSVVKKTKSSESKLITAYEDMTEKTEKYANAYKKHMFNLKMLDDYINFNGMETLFTKVIMKDNFIKGKIDKSNPLLFRNYLIEGEVLPSTFRREHILNQIRYFMNKSFGGRDQAFIKYTNVSNINKDDFLLNLVTIDNAKESKVISHNDFLIDKEKTKNFIEDVITSTKKKLKRDSIIAYFDNNSKKSSRNKSRTRGTKKTKTYNSLNSKSKNKSKSMYHISTIKHSKNSSKKTKKTLMRELNNEFLEPYEKHLRNEKRKADLKKKEIPADKGFENKKQGILGNPYEGQARPNIDPDKAKCESYGEDKDTCLSDPKCRFAKYGKCAWKDPNYKPPGMYQAMPEPTLGASPQPNPFAIQEKRPEPLF